MIKARGIILFVLFLGLAFIGYYPKSFAQQTLVLEGGVSVNAPASNPVLSSAPAAQAATPLSSAYSNSGIGN
jgi:hypothetical protein